MPEIKIGDTVEVTGRGKGTVTDVIPDETRVRVRLEDGTAIATPLSFVKGAAAAKNAEKG